MMIGYARVYTENQYLDLQIQALQGLGCHKAFTDQGISGKTASRPAWTGRWPD